MKLMASKLMLTVLFCLISFQGQALDKGYHYQVNPFPELLFPTQDIYRQDLVSNRIESFIEDQYAFRTNPNHRWYDPTISNEHLSRKIAQAAECFQIDPYIFAGLVAQESAFNTQATSPTGAAGVTQFTTSGIYEACDQLGLRGPGYAVPETTLYHRQRIQYCVESTMLGGAPWIDIWQRTPVAKHKKFTRDWFNAVKKELKADPNAALVFGAILIKGNVSRIARKRPQFNIENVYRQSLRDYNGDPKAREHYQARILNFSKVIMKY